MNTKRIPMVIVLAAALAASVLPAAAVAAPAKSHGVPVLCSTLTTSKPVITSTGRLKTASFTLTNDGTCSTTVTAVSLVRTGPGLPNWKTVKLGNVALVCHKAPKNVAYDSKHAYPGVTCVVPATLGDLFAPNATQAATATFTASTGVHIGVVPAIS